MPPEAPLRTATARARTAALPLLLLSAGACGAEEQPPAPAPPPAPATAPATAASPAAGPMRVRFVDLHEDATGYGPLNHSGVPGEKPWIAEAKGGGTLLFDCDGDGDIDILFVDGNGVDRPPHPDARTRLFRNDGGMKFTDVTRESGIDVTGVGFGGAAADYDGDGDVDAYVCMLGRNRLLRNDGDGTFTDVAAASGVEGGERDMSTACCWADFDGDGRLDLFVSNYVDMLGDVERFRREGRDPLCPWHGIRVFRGPCGLTYQKDRLYLAGAPDPATGAVAFRDASDRLLDQVPRPSFQCVAADFDGDGDADVYVAEDSEPNALWINDGKGTFRDEGMAAGCAFGVNGNPQAGMGVDVGDYDRDGRLDITVTNFSEDSNSLYRSRCRPRQSGQGRIPDFQDECVGAGVSGPSHLPVCWSAHFTDADNDGDEDLYYSAGHVYPGIDGLPGTGTAYRQRSLLLENGGGGKPVFSDASGRAGPGFQIAEVHRGGGVADLDDDGDEDIVVSVLNGRAYILRNDGGNANGWIRISLRGKAPRDPAGALVRVEAAGLLPQTSVALRGNGFLSCSDPRMLFGLGAAKEAAKVTVTWPSGARSGYAGLSARAHWLLEEGVPAAKRLPK